IRGPLLPGAPNGVLTTMSTSPARIRSTTLPGPSLYLPTTSQGTPLRRSTCAVPDVASTRKPRSASRLTGKIADRLSRLATDTNTVPDVGSEPYAAACDLAKAGPNPASRPMTSPVDFI